MKDERLKGGYEIVVLTRGFVYVGDVEIAGDQDDWLIIRRADNIRKWGTTRGLGQLALQGPQVETVLDPVGVVKAPLIAVIHRMECNEKRWAKHRDLHDTESD